MKLPRIAAVLLLAVRLVASPVDEMAGAAGNFLAALSDDQRGKATFAFDSDERENWHFIPKERKGLTLKEMNPAQRHLAYALLSTGLSQRGLAKAVTIMSLEQILAEIEGPSRKFPRDPELYHVSIFGKPEGTGTWGWRVEGHHLSVNFTIVDGKVAAGTPSFMGTNPAEVRVGSRAGLRVLAHEEDLGRQLVKSLDAEQQKTAIVDTKAPDDVVTAASRKAEVGKPIGIAFSRLKSEQRALAFKLIREYVQRLRGEVADVEIAKIEKSPASAIYFAWEGGLEKGDRHYYRVHGPTFLLEYDNTQNDANHIHAVWREFNGDFGRDVLAAHYQMNHSK
jgi:hypothetical protein